MPGSDPRTPLTVAIDGPAAAGKSSVARAVATRLGLTYVDTGAMYRALALKALLAGLDPEDGPAVADLAARTEIGFTPALGPDESQRVTLDGCDVSWDIRSREVDVAVSPVSRYPAVRAWFRDLQRRFAAVGGVVMEGRDIGTVVLPEADVKIFLDAALESRVDRRYRELRAKGYRPARAQVREDMALRDRLDSTREDGPLSVAPGAVRIDTTDKSLAEVVDEVTRLCLRRRGRTR